VHVASAYTVAPPAADVEEFLDHLRRGQHEAAGQPRRQRFVGPQLVPYYLQLLPRPHPGLARRKADDHRADARTTPFDGAHRADRRAGLARARLRPAFRAGSPAPRADRVERLLVEKVAELADRGEPAAPRDTQSDDRRAFQTACRVAHELGYRLIQEFADQIRKGRVIEGVQSPATLGVAAMGIAPYLTAFAAQHKDEPLLQPSATASPPPNTCPAAAAGKAWITDTFVDVNGVSRTVQCLARPRESRASR